MTCGLSRVESFWASWLLGTVAPTTQGSYFFWQIPSTINVAVFVSLLHLDAQTYGFSTCVLRSQLTQLHDLQIQLQVHAVPRLATFSLHILSTSQHGFSYKYISKKGFSRPPRMLVELLNPSVSTSLSLLNLVYARSSRHPSALFCCVCFILLSHSSSSPTLYIVFQREERSISQVFRRIRE